MKVARTQTEHVSHGIRRVYNEEEQEADPSEIKLASWKADLRTVSHLGEAQDKKKKNKGKMAVMVNRWRRFQNIYCIENIGEIQLNVDFS